MSTSVQPGQAVQPESTFVPSGLGPVPVLIDGRSTAIALEEALGGVAELPEIAAEIYDPDPAIVATGIVYGVTTDAEFGTSVYCKDMLPAASSYSQLESQDDAADLPQFSGVDTYAQMNARGCKVWNVQPDDSSDFAPIVSDIPTFLYGGGLDPWYPPNWVTQIAQGLTHAVTVVFPTLTQGMIETQSAPPCLTDLERQFLDDPTAHLGVSKCEAQSPPISFLGR